MSSDNSKANVTANPSQTLEENEKMMTSAMRTFFVVFALSFHAVMDGLAIRDQMLKMGLPGKLILSKRKGLLEVLFA